MKFLEKDLENIIWECLGNADKTSKLFRRGLEENWVNPLDMFYIRQCRLGLYGLADIIAITKDDSCIEYNVIELKKDTVNSDTIIQVLKYGNGLFDFHIQHTDLKYKVHYCLIGKKVDENSCRTLLTFLKSLGIIIDIYTYKYDVEGLIFETYTLPDFENGFEDLRYPMQELTNIIKGK